MKIVCISDTHCHDLTKLNLPEGDLLIHAGDFTYKGTAQEIYSAMLELGEVAKKYKYGAIMIAGNHDWLFERKPTLAESLVPKNVVYLNDSMIEINGIKIWGSPVQPEFCSWAFNKKRGEEIQKHWDMIPEEVDILITHGPVYGLLDTVERGVITEHVGCQDLLETIKNRVRPKFHICGHIHEGHGIFTLNETTYVNASLLDDYYNLIFDPIVIEI